MKPAVRPVVVAIKSGVVMKPSVFINQQLYGTNCSHKTRFCLKPVVVLKPAVITKQQLFETSSCIKTVINPGFV